MQLITIFTSALIAGLAVAAPTAGPLKEVQARQEADIVPMIDMWQDADFLGLKLTGSSTVQTCVNLPDDFNNVITSAKSKDGFRCTLWVRHDCLGTGFSFNAKNGIDQLPDWIDEESSSWKCVTA